MHEYVSLTYDDITTSFAERLKPHREDLAMTPAQMADLTGLRELDLRR